MDERDFQSVNLSSAAAVQGYVFLAQSVLGFWLMSGI